MVAWSSSRRSNRKQNALPFLLLAIPFAYAHVEARWVRFLHLVSRQSSIPTRESSRLTFQSTSARRKHVCASFRLVSLRRRSEFPPQLLLFRPIFRRRIVDIASKLSLWTGNWWFQINSNSFEEITNEPSNQTMIVTSFGSQPGNKSVRE